MEPDRDLRVAMGLIIAGLGPLVVAALLVPLRDHMINANVALVMTVVVVVAASVGGGRAGAFAGVVSAISYDFFFTQPYLQLTIDAQDDIETTILLLAVGVMVGSLASRMRRADEAAERGRTELDRLRRISEEIAAGTSRAHIIAAAERELRGPLHLDQCTFEVGALSTSLVHLERTGALSERPRVLYFHERGVALPATGAELPVYARGSLLGRFVLKPSSGQGVTLEERLVAVAVADQIGAALAASPASPTTNHTPDPDPRTH